MSIQPMRHKRKRQALRLRPIHEPLKVWLNLIKDIPGGQELPEWTVPESRVVTSETLKTWYRSISNLPDNVQRFIREAGDPASSLERYQYLKGMVDVLRRVVRHRSHLAMGAVVNLEDLILVEPISLRVNEDGRIEVVQSRLASALEGVEIDRIRQCENKDCRRIFWAGRIDQPCCSKKCANSRRVQRWRERYESTYKQNRIKKEERSILGTTIKKVTGVNEKRRTKGGK